MLEYLVYIKDGIDFDKEAKLIERFNEASVLIDEPTKIHYIKDNKAIVLYRHRFDYQGIPVNIQDDGFCAIVGYVVSNELNNDPDTISNQVNNKLLEVDKEWLDASLGEFQIVHFQDDILNFYLSRAMTHPLYYCEEGDGIFISNRSSVIANNLSTYPSINVLSQLEVIAFDSIINGCSAFEGIHCLRPGEDIQVDFRERQATLEISHSSFYWSNESTASYSVDEAHQGCKKLVAWMVDHLAILPKQMKLPDGMVFNLSGGKDSRLLLALFVKSGFIKSFDHVLTLGNEGDAEVRAAKMVTDHYQLKHVVKPRVVSGNRLFELLPLHLFQLEGEISCRILHGNHLGRRKPVFTGHEAGLRESFPNLESVVDYDTVDDYINSSLPIDSIGIIADESKKLIYNSVRNLKEKALTDGVQGHNFFNWFSIVGRGHRWVGKLTSMSSAAGLYANLLCSTPVVRLAHQLGFVNRSNEVFHFSMLAELDSDLLKIPFADQKWKPLIFENFSDSYEIVETEIKSHPKTDKNWWDEMYERNDRSSLISAINSSRNSILDAHINYDVLFSYMRKVNRPSSRAMLSIFSILSAHLFYQVNGKMTLNSVDMMKRGSQRINDAFNSAEAENFHAIVSEENLFLSRVIGAMPVGSKFINIRKSPVTEERYGLFLHGGYSLKLTFNKEISLLFKYFSVPAVRGKIKEHTLKISTSGQLMEFPLMAQPEIETATYSINLSGEVELSSVSEAGTEFGWTFIEIIDVGSSAA